MGSCVSCQGSDKGQKKAPQPLRRLQTDCYSDHSEIEDYFEDHQKPDTITFKEVYDKYWSHCPPHPLMNIIFDHAKNNITDHKPSVCMIDVLHKYDRFTTLCI